MSSITRPDREFVRGLEHGLRVIETFDGAHTQMTLSEIARRAKLTPATARRSLNTLTGLGYMRLANGRYLLGARILSLASAYLQSSAAEDLLEPELRILVGKFGDSAGLSVLLGNNILYVAYASSQRGMRPVVAGAGVTFPAHATSTGRVLLGGLSDAELDEWFRTAAMQKLTDRTETDPRRLRTVVRSARRQGYAIVRDELYYGITSLAVPVLSAAGSVVAALNASAYSGLFPDRKLLDTRLAPMQEAAQSLSHLMNAHPSLLNSFATEDKDARLGASQHKRQNAGSSDAEPQRKGKRCSAPSWIVAEPVSETDFELGWRTSEWISIFPMNCK